MGSGRGRYSGSHMTYGSILPGASKLARIPTLSKTAKIRVKWFDYHRTSKSVAKTCRYFGISRKTFYKWQKRYSPYYLSKLENRSRKPARLRSSRIPPEHLFRVKKLRTRYPYYSKYKLAVILRRDYGIMLSASTVGRIIKKYDLFFKPKYPAKKKRHASRIAIERLHLPATHAIRLPGDLIESDMKHMPFLGKKRYAFVAIDCIGKGIAIKVAGSATALQNSELIDKVRRTFPFSIKAWENDNGSENFKDFHEKLAEAKIPHYFAHPYCPKDKPYVERVIGTLEREFIQQGKLISTLEEQQRF
jgi:transposase